MRVLRLSDHDRKEFEPWTQLVPVATFLEYHSDAVRCEYDAKRMEVDTRDRHASRLPSSTCPGSFCCTQQWRLPDDEISTFGHPDGNRGVPSFDDNNFRDLGFDGQVQEHA